MVTFLLAIYASLTFSARPLNGRRPKVVDLIRSFLDADLIPAIILWRAGASIFVIDGAHRLSAILAWILDDYGDRKKSLDHSGGYITPEQRRVADRTRDLVDKSVGSYAEYQAFRNNRAAAPPEMQKRLSNLADNSFVAQWVTTSDVGTAEDSFFKINQQGTPIDPTERRLIRSRDSASAIASRSITHAGSGHKYWKSFVGDKQIAIETAGKELYRALYNPPIRAPPLAWIGRRGWPDRRDDWSGLHRNAVDDARCTGSRKRLQCAALCI